MPRKGVGQLNQDRAHRGLTPPPEKWSYCEACDHPLLGGQAYDRLCSHCFYHEECTACGQATYHGSDLCEDCEEWEEEADGEECE